MLFRSGIVTAAAIYLRQIATRTKTPNAVSTAAGRQMMTVSGHIAMDDISQLKIAVPNWYVDVSSNGVEKDGGLVDTCTASIEYPIGTYTQVLFNGSASSSIPAGGLLWSDFVSVSIPKSAQFRCRIFRNTSAGNLIWHNNTTSTRSATFGDALAYGSAVSDATMGGTVTSTGTSEQFFSPWLIVALTRQNSVVLIGDSRTQGRGDTPDSSGDLGNLARSVGPSYPYANLGISSDRAAWVAANNTKRFAALPYFTHAIIELGTNDEFAGATLAAEQSAYATIVPLVRAGLQSGGKIYGTTHEPRVTAHGSVTPATGETVRVAWNDYLRGGGYATSGMDGFFEIADVLESARNSGLWGNSAWEVDGTHETQAGYLQIVTAGAISPTAFA